MKAAIKAVIKMTTAIVSLATLLLAVTVASAVLFAPPFSSAQTPGGTPARRLILKDGSYQSVTKYEIQGERVRYFSAERGEWEEIPKSLIDWPATEKFEQGREDAKIAPEAAALDKELDAERKAELARSPQVAPGLRLPDEGGVFLLDTYLNKPELAELQQSGSELEKNTKSNILRSTINPLAGVKQTIELPGSHAKIQSHTSLPSLYVNVDLNNGANGNTQAGVGDQALPPNDRFKIIRIEVKGGKRVAGSVKTAVTGKTKSDGRYVPATSVAMTGGWVKISPTEPLPGGEYAIAEMLGREGMNVYVWDFGVNSSAPANPGSWKPEPEALPKTDQPAALQKRDSQ